MLTILNIYAPNAPSDNEKFWKDLQLAFNTNPFPYPDILLGDFNIVEDAINRLPSHNNNANTREVLFEFRSQLELIDGWRTYNENEKGYTYTKKPDMIRSRIDRIYTTSSIFNTASDWEINNSPIESDHCLTSVKISDPSMPWQGHGQWKLPLFLPKDRVFQSESRKLAHKLNEAIMSAPTCTNANNPQILFKTFKDRIKELAINTAKTTIPKLTKKLIQLKQEHKAIINNNSLSNHERMAQAGPIHNQIDQLEKKKFQKAKNTTRTRFTLEGETITKYWSLINKENKPCDPVFSLCKLGSDPPEYESNSHCMAEITRKHHENLLTEGIHPDDTEREAAIIQVLDDVDKASCLPPQCSEELNTPITEDLIKLTLQESATDTAPGINGLPYELWKMLATDHKESNKLNKGTPNQRQQTAPDLNEPVINVTPLVTKETKILETFTKIYLDVKRYGVHDNSEFAAGWLCPLYKKRQMGDRELPPYHPSQHRL